MQGAPLPPIARAALATLADNRSIGRSDAKKPIWLFALDVFEQPTLFHLTTSPTMCQQESIL